MERFRVQGLGDTKYLRQLDTACCACSIIYEAAHLPRRSVALAGLQKCVWPGGGRGQGPMRPTGESVLLLICQACVVVAHEGCLYRCPRLHGVTGRHLTQRGDTVAHLHSRLTA